MSFWFTITNWGLPSSSSKVKLMFPKSALYHAIVERKQNLTVILQFLHPPKLSIIDNWEAKYKDEIKKFIHYWFSINKYFLFYFHLRWTKLVRGSLLNLKLLRFPLRFWLHSQIRVSCSQKQEWKRTDPDKYKWFRTGRMRFFKSCEPFLDAFLLIVWLCVERITTFFWTHDACCFLTS